MPVAIAIGAAAVVGGAATVISGTKAANAQKDAANASIAEQQRQYNQTRDDQAPWRTVGGGAITKLGGMYGISSGGPATASASSLSDPYGGYQQSPGYKFQLDQGVQAAERSAAARGLLGSGAAVKGITRFASGLADSDYQQYVNQLNTLAGFGQTATQATSQAGQNAANNISAAYTNAGNARASSYANVGSAINSTLNNLAGAYAYGKGSSGPYGGTNYPYGGTLGAIY